MHHEAPVFTVTELLSVTVPFSLILKSSLSAWCDSDMYFFASSPCAFLIFCPFAHVPACVEATLGFRRDSPVGFAVPDSTSCQSDDFQPPTCDVAAQGPHRGPEVATGHCLEAEQMEIRCTPSHWLHLNNEI